MKVKETYPVPKKWHSGRLLLMTICKWLFLFSGFICVVVNVCTGGNAWCLVVIWSMWLIWAQLVSPDMVEYNRISQAVKLVVNTCVLLALINFFLVPGWASAVVPIVCFSGLIAVALLFFTDFETQKQNMLPMLFFCTACLLAASIVLIVHHGDVHWAVIVMGTLALSLLFSCIAKLGKAFLKECIKRFSTK